MHSVIHSIRYFAQKSVKLNITCCCLRAWNIIKWKSLMLEKVKISHTSGYFPLLIERLSTYMSYIFYMKIYDIYRWIHVRDTDIYMCICIYIHMYIYMHMYIWTVHGTKKVLSYSKWDRFLLFFYTILWKEMSCQGYSNAIIYC